MADKANTKQINPYIPLNLYTQLLGHCQEHRVTQSDVVQAAVEAFLMPNAGGDGLQVLLEEVQAVKAVQLKQIQLLTVIVERFEAGSKPGAVPVASYGSLYPGKGFDSPAPAEEEATLVGGQDIAVEPIQTGKPKWLLWGRKP